MYIIKKIIILLLSLPPYQYIDSTFFILLDAGVVFFLGIFEHAWVKSKFLVSSVISLV